MSLSRKVLTGTSAILMALSLSACGSPNATGMNSGNSSVAMASSSKLARMNYKSGHSAFVNVNRGKSTLNPKSWKSDHVIYSNLDHENRTSKGNTGWLDKKNIANDSLRTQQIVKPTGYHQKFVNNEAIINRGHEIAYSLSKGISKNGKYNPKSKSGDQNNPKNLFTQTAFSNQEVQTVYESKVRNALKHGDKVIYQVTPVFKGADLMPKGVHMQAISTNRKLNFNVYLYNVQPGIKFNYLTGRSVIDRGMKVPTPKGAPHFNDQRSAKRSYGRRSYYPHSHHHFIRDYAAYRIGKHVIRHHMRKHYARKYGYRYHSILGRRHYRRW